MSHFSVLVIGDDVEKQLKDYDESLKVKPYKKFFTFEAFTGWCEQNGYEIKSLTDFLRFVEEYTGSKEFGIEPNARDSSLLYYYTTYNPKAKWDWYTIGGRWGGFFKLRKGEIAKLATPGMGLISTVKHTHDNRSAVCADQARVHQIDFKGMKEDAIKEANKFYDKVENLLKDANAKLPDLTWKETLDKYNGNVKLARAEYNQYRDILERIEGLSSVFVFNDPVELLRGGREAYVKRCADRAYTTYAVVKDGVWYGKGTMGWFGVSVDEIDENKWNWWFNALIDEFVKYEPNTLLTIVDCHI